MTYGWGPGEGDEGVGQWWSDSGINLLMGVGRYDKAQTAIYGVLEKDPTDVRALCVLMRCQSRLAEHEKAMETSAEITRLDPLHGCAWVQRSILYESLGQPAKAEENAREAIRLEPERVDARVRLAWLLSEDPSRGAEAETAVRHALRLDPDNRSALSILAHAQLVDGNLTEAEQTVRALLAVDPVNAWALQALGRIYWQRGDNEEAARLLRSAVAADPLDQDVRASLAEYERWMKLTSPLRAIKWLLEKRFPGSTTS